MTSETNILNEQKASKVKKITGKKKKTKKNR